MRRNRALYSDSTAVRDSRVRIEGQSSTCLYAVVRASVNLDIIKLELLFLNASGFKMDLSWVSAGQGKSDPFFCPN
jgi:hypothetical protein